jgi:hypothetical protein
MKNETSKATPAITATDVLAVAAKSEVVPTTLIRHDSMESNKTQKTSYVQRNSIFNFHSNFDFLVKQIMIANKKIVKYEN